MDKNKRNVAAGGAIVLLVLCLLVGIYAWRHKTTDEPATQGPVYAYADTEHIMMSHTDYAVYHRLTRKAMQHNRRRDLAYPAHCRPPSPAHPARFDAWRGKTKK